MRRTLVAILLALGLTVAVAPAASAHVGQVAISCTEVDFAYTNFSDGATANETVSIDGVQVVATTFTFSGTGGSDAVPINVPSGTHIVAAHADWTADGGGSVDLTQTLSCGSPPPCPGEKINFRWHYSANGSSGSWSGTKSTICDGSTFTMGPQAMEGDLKVTPGTTLMAGYDFTIPGNNSTLSVTVNNPQVVFTVRCVSGASPSQSTLTVPMATTSYTVTNSAWYPSGDQHSPLVYQGSITVPDVCGGGQVRLDKGGTFSASVT